MSSISAIVATGILAALATLQLLVAAGLPLGKFVWGGVHRTLPRRLRVGSACSVLIYAGIAAILLSRGGVLPGANSTFVVVAAWVAFAFFVLSVVANSLSRSRIERWTMVPTSVLLAGATLAVNIG